MIEFGTKKMMPQQTAPIAVQMSARFRGMPTLSHFLSTPSAAGSWKALQRKSLLHFGQVINGDR